MQFQSFFKQTLKWLLVASMFSFGLAMAQSEPTLDQVYATARSGKLDQAQLMIQQVLISHPASAKAFFVQSELYARQADLGKARDALATAEKLAPGLPFAKAQSVQALRAQVAAKNTPLAVSGATPHSVALTRGDEARPFAPMPSPSSSWLLPLLLAGGVIGLGYFLFRNRRPGAMAQAGYSSQDGMSGPQTFGMGNGAVMPAPYGQVPGSGLGGRIMGGVATGLAVGAGVMAAEAIGRHLMGGSTPPAGAANGLASPDFQVLDSNPDMGGPDFGIKDASSWDSSSADIGSASDWDT